MIYWLTSKPLEIEDKISITLIIDYCVTCRMKYSTEPRNRIFVKGYEFLCFAKNTDKDIVKYSKYSKKLKQLLI